MNKINTILIVLQFAIIISYYCFLEWMNHSNVTNFIVNIITLIVFTGTSVITTSLIAFSLISYYINAVLCKYYG